jgi:hypothetical protein
MVIKVGFDEFERRCRVLAKKIKKIKGVKSLYGIPRGGLAIVLRVSHLTGLPITFNPNKKTTVILDDCIDSGATKQKFKDFKHFFVLIDKQKEKISEWIVYWWEEK